MVSSPKKRVLEKRTIGFRYGDILDYMSAFCLIYVLAMNSYWSNAIRTDSGPSPPALATQSPAYILSTGLAVTAGLMIFYLVFRPAIPFLKTARNTLVFFALCLLVLGSLLLREIYYYYQHNSPLGSSTPFSTDDGKQFEPGIISAELGACFTAVIVGCFVIMKEL